MSFPGGTSVVVAVDHAGKPFQRILIGELLLELCLVTKSLVVVLNEVRRVDCLLDALRKFVKRKETGFILKKLMKSLVLRSIRVEEGCQLLPCKCSILNVLKRI